MGKRFSDESNKQYTFGGDELTNKDILEYVQHHEKRQAPRLQQLVDYFKGDNTTILSKERRKDKDAADNRATHNFGRYVSNFMQGYFVGVPVVVESDSEKVNDELDMINQIIETDALNAEIELDCSIGGRAYELLIRNKQDQVKAYLSDFKTTFVVYDKTVEQSPIAGIRYRYESVNDILDKNKYDDVLFVDVYTDKKVTTYSRKNQEDLHVINEQAHFFGGVPIIEYQNNRFRMGDYESVLDLIDMYDSATSDTANYSQDLQDALLLIIGNMEMTMEEAKEAKEARILRLIPSINADGKEGQTDGKYIYKQYDVSGMEAYKDRLERDIHKFTLTPDMGESQFQGQTSGEAMRYRLFGLEQLRINKERMFKRSLSRRYELINYVKSFASEMEQDVLLGLTYTFTPNLPKSLSDAVSNFTALGGELSEETKLKLLPMLVDNPKEEVKRTNEESKERMKNASNPLMDDEN